MDWVELVNSDICNALKPYLIRAVTVGLLASLGYSLIFKLRAGRGS